jgi:hypothetical protein
METGYGIETIQTLYTPTFYKWKFVIENNQSFASPKLSDSEIIYSYTTYGYSYTNKSSINLYWTGHAKSGTQIYQLTENKIDNNSQKVKNDTSEQWPSTNSYKNLWSTPLVGEHEISIDIYDTPGSLVGLLYYSDKYVINQTTSTWKFTAIEYINKIFETDTDEIFTGTINKPLSVILSIKSGKITNIYVKPYSGVGSTQYYMNELKSSLITEQTTTNIVLGPDSLWFPSFTWE